MEFQDKLKIEIIEVEIREISGYYCTDGEITSEKTGQIINITQIEERSSRERLRR